MCLIVVSYKILHYIGGGEIVTHACFEEGGGGEGSGDMPPPGKFLNLILHSLRLILMPFWSQIYGPPNSAD